MNCFDFWFCFKGNVPNTPKAHRKERAISSVKSLSTPKSDTVESFGDSNDNVTDLYTFGRVLGEGSYAIVREAVCKRTGVKYAIKCIRRSNLLPEEEKGIAWEVAILKEMRHPNIMEIIGFYDTMDYFYIVSELIEGGELFDRIVEKSCYSEREARDLVATLLHALRYMHENGIVHRDLKPENLLLLSSTDNTLIKIVDFGFAKQLLDGADGMRTACGTPGYMAPEVLRRELYGKPVDVWSLGIIVYILLCGYPPFFDESDTVLCQKILEGKIEFDSPYWDEVSAAAKSFICKMLIVDPNKRATMEELCQDPWITGSDIASDPLASALVELRCFNAKARFKAAIHSVHATISMKNASTSSAIANAKACYIRPNEKEYTAPH